MMSNVIFIVGLISVLIICVAYVEVRLNKETGTINGYLHQYADAIRKLQGNTSPKA